MEPGQVYRVGALVTELRTLLEASYRNVWVEGEISGLATPASGHLYFSLKEEGALVRCAFFRNRRAGSETPTEGMQVLVRGQVSVYPNRGDLQLIVHHLEAAGEGALRRAFEALKRKLSAEGLFDAARKRPLPRYPRIIGVITSQSGAALHDILVTLRRRYPAARVVVFPALVQGAGAANELCAMLERAGDFPSMEVVILARGGGSLEDLQAFNEENVARAIHRCAVPVVSGVGHETDITIADLVADHRAATPTAAAELVTPLAAEILQDLRRQQVLLLRALERRLDEARQRVDHAAARLVHPAERLARHRLQLDGLLRRLQGHTREVLTNGRHRLRLCQDSLRANNPRRALAWQRQRLVEQHRRIAYLGRASLADFRRQLAGSIDALRLLGPGQTLARGYAILRNADQQVITSAREANTGQNLDALLTDGTLSLTVTGKTPE